MAGYDGRHERKGHRGTRGGLGDLGLLALVVLLAYPPSAPVAAQYAGGAGTQGAPFLISTAEDFRAIGDNPADWDKRFKLTQDIDLSDYSEANLRMIGHWVMLGSTANRPFTGEFDGNDKTIFNFRYKNLTDDYVGLFQYVTGVIKNLKLVRATVVGSKAGVGSLVGNLDQGSIAECSATAVSVTGNSRVGGLVGATSGIMSMSYSSGSVSGTLYVGGLVGQAGSGTVGLSYSKVHVIGDQDVGGLIGITLGDSFVNSCYATGDVEGRLYVGGLIGELSPGMAWHCYCVGRVSGSQYVGGLVGQLRAQASVLGSLWDTQTSQQTTSAGGTGATTAQMKSEDTFTKAGWDFSQTWTNCPGVGYPVFFWQIPLGDRLCPDGVDFRDFAWFASYWHWPCNALNGYCDGADLDGSGTVEFRDLVIFAENWLAGM